MNQVYACIDGVGNSEAVIDSAIWAAQRLGAPLGFLHVIAPGPSGATVGDYGSAIGLGAQDSVLQTLSEPDEQQLRLAQQFGRRLLAEAQQRAEACSLTRVAVRLRHGDLLDVVSELEADARLFVLGQHHRAPAGGSRLHLDHRVERIIRSLTRPVLVVTGAGSLAPRRCVIAIDGSATAAKAVKMVARSPLLAGLPVRLVTVGSDTLAARVQLQAEGQRLREAGFEVDEQIVPGQPETVLPTLVKEQDPALLVIGAYGHSRIRQLILGSTTTTLLRTAEVPVLVLR